MSKRTIIIILIVIAAIVAMKQFEIGPFRTNAGENWPDSPF